MELLQAVENYIPYNEQEKQDRIEILRRLRSGEELFSRDNSSAHITVSGWVVSHDRTKVLMAYHNIYNSWSWLGGHADGERNLLSVAGKEIKEETGLESFAPVTDDIFSLEILTVDGHVKKGHYVSSHLHLNFTFLFEADPDQPIRCKPDENRRVGWFGTEEAVDASDEPWIRDRIYRKLNDRMKEFFS